MNQTSDAITGVKNFVHFGLVVEDLEETLRFLTVLGFDCGEPGVYSGRWIDRIVALDDVTIELVMARLPDGSDVLEVTRFRAPSASAQELEPAANHPGLRHISFSVEDLPGIVERVRAAGWEPVGEIVDYEDLYLLCYIRGPEGLIVELAESIGAAGQSSSTGVTWSLSLLPVPQQDDGQRTSDHLVLKQAQQVRDTGHGSAVELDYQIANPDPCTVRGRVA